MSRKPPVVVVLKSTPTPPPRREWTPLKHEYVPKQKPNPLHAAAVWLGPRLVLNDTGCHRLDGLPASLDTIMRETNRVLASQGVEMITASDRWLP